MGLNLLIARLLPFLYSQYCVPEHVPGGGATPRIFHRNGCLVVQLWAKEINILPEWAKKI